MADYKIYLHQLFTIYLIKINYIIFIINLNNLYLSSMEKSSRAESPSSLNTTVDINKKLK